MLQEEDEQVEVEEEEDEPAAPGMKQARRNDQYTLCIKYGLAGIASRFGLSAEQVSNPRKINTINNLKEISEGSFINDVTLKPLLH